MENYSAIKRNAFESVLMRWMDLKPIIQSEVSQKEKDKYRILMHIYIESIKMVLKNLFTGQQWRNRHREQTYGHGERGGEGEMYGNSNMEIYNTIQELERLALPCFILLFTMSAPLLSLPAASFSLHTHQHIFAL